MRFGTLDITCTGTERPLAGAVFPRSLPREDALRPLRDAANAVLADMGRDSTPAPSGHVRATADRFFATIQHLLPSILGPTTT